MRFIASSIFALTCFSVSTTALAADASYINACAASLKMNDVTSFKDEVLEYAFMNYIVQTSNDNQDFQSKFGGLTPYGYFDGSLSDARTKAETLDKRLNLHWNKQLSEGYVMKYLSPDGASEFSKCVKNVFDKDKGLHASIKEVDENLVSVHLKYNPSSSGENNPAYRFSIFSDGDLPNGFSAKIPSQGVEREISFTRANPSKSMHIQVEVTSHGTTLDGVTLFIPPSIKTEDVIYKSPEPIRSADSKVSCSGYNRWQYGRGPDVSIRTKDPSAEFDMSTLAKPVASHETGPGGCGNSVMIITEPNMGKQGAMPHHFITAYVSCEPGSDKNHICDVSGHIEAVETKTTTKIVIPTDNGVARKFRRVGA